VFLVKGVRQQGRRPSLQAEYKTFSFHGADHRPFFPALPPDLHSVPLRKRHSSFCTRCAGGPDVGLLAVPPTLFFDSRFVLLLRGLFPSPPSPQNLQPSVTFIFFPPPFGLHRPEPQSCKSPFLFFPPPTTKGRSLLRELVQTSVARRANGPQGNTPFFFFARLTPVSFPPRPHAVLTALFVFFPPFLIPGPRGETARLQTVKLGYDFPHMNDI